MIYEYQCQTCGHEQEIWLRMEEKNMESCKKCKAPPKKMKKVINWKPAHGKHGSWGRWTI